MLHRDLPSSDNLFYQISGNVVSIAGINNGDEAEQWLRDYGSSQNVVWRVLRTFPQSSVLAGKLFVYKKQFRCQHNTTKKPTTGSSTWDHSITTGITKERPKSKNTNCPAKVLMTISRKSKTEYKCTATFTAEHNHPTSSREALHYQPLSEATRSQMEQLYRRGHTPATAHVSFCLRLANRLGSEGFVAARRDRRQVPTKADFYAEWKRLRLTTKTGNPVTPTSETVGRKKEEEEDSVSPSKTTCSGSGKRAKLTRVTEDVRRNEAGSTRDECDSSKEEGDIIASTITEMNSYVTRPPQVNSEVESRPLRALAPNLEGEVARLRTWCEEYRREGRQCSLSENDGQVAVALCSPFMLRAHQLPQSGHLLYVDVPGHCEALRHRIYVFLALSAAGGLPLGFVLTDRSKGRVFAYGVADLQSLLPRWSFGGSGAPETIVLGDCRDVGGGELPSEVGVLKSAWPQSSVLLGATGVLSSCWRWLHNNANSVPAEHRQYHYGLLKDAVYAGDEQTLTVARDRIRTDSVYPAFTRYATRLCRHSHLWAVRYLQDVAPDHALATFRQRADTTLRHTGTFRLHQLVDFVGHEFDDFYRQSLMDALRGAEATFQLQPPGVSTTTRVDASDSVSFTADAFPLDGTAIVPLTQRMFLVPSASKPGIYYIVDTNIGGCSCTSSALTTSAKGICYHQKALVGQRLSSTVAALNPSDRAALYRVVTGLATYVHSQPEADCSPTADEQPPPQIELAMEQPVVEQDSEATELTVDGGEPEEIFSNASDATLTTLATAFVDISDWVRTDPTNQLLALAVRRFRDNLRDHVTTTAALVAGLEAAFVPAPT